ncbi:MAG: hypothetical protein MJZ96_00315 [Paludibacteraceae bacterium]|nr:hypothetical protein [Paludibacteraceae bacterium]
MKLEVSKTNIIMTIEYIEDQILLHSNSTENKDIAHCQAYLEQRKKLLNEEFINHLEEHLSELADFNERMTTALRTLWEDTQKCFDISKNMDDFDIEIRAYLELDAEKDDNEKNWFEIFCLLSDPTYNPLYKNGVCLLPIILTTKIEAFTKSFDEFIGNDGNSWNEGLPNELTKDIPLTMMFHHLFDHTYWSLYDIVKIKHFNAVLNTTFEKKYKHAHTPNL